MDILKKWKNYLIEKYKGNEKKWKSKLAISFI